MTIHLVRSGMARADPLPTGAWGCAASAGLGAVVCDVPCPRALLGLQGLYQGCQGLG